MWTTVRLVAELTPGGGVIPTVEFLTFNLYRDAAITSMAGASITRTDMLEGVVFLFYSYFILIDIAGVL